MSTQPNPMTHPDEFRQFVFVVDGDVGHVMYMANTLEGPIACLQSNPTIVEVTGEMKGLVTIRGWTYDGQNFIPPVIGE